MLDLPIADTYSVHLHRLACTLPLPHASPPTPSPAYLPGTFRQEKLGEFVALTPITPGSGLAELAALQKAEFGFL